jgi:hypothetical protein
MCSAAVSATKNEHNTRLQRNKEDFPCRVARPFFCALSLVRLEASLQAAPALMPPEK